MIQQWRRIWAVSALMIGWSAHRAIADDTYWLKGLPEDRLTATTISPEVVSLARGFPSDDDLEPVNLRYRLGYARGWSGGSYILPRTYAWRVGYWHGYFGYPSFARYWVTYPTYYYRPWVTTTYYYAAPIPYCYPPIAYDVCATPIRFEVQSSSTGNPLGTDLLPESLPRSRNMPTEETGPARPPALLPPQPGEPTPKPAKPDAGTPPSDVRLVHDAGKSKRYRYPAYGEHLRSADADTDRTAARK